MATTVRPSDWQLAEWREERDVHCRQLLANPSDRDRRAATQRLRVLAFLIKRYDPASPAESQFADLGSAGSLEEFDLEALQPINEPEIPLAEPDTRLQQLEYESVPLWTAGSIAAQSQVNAFPVVLSPPILEVLPLADPTIDLPTDVAGPAPAITDDAVVAILMARPVVPPRDNTDVMRPREWSRADSFPSVGEDGLGETMHRATGRVAGRTGDASSRTGFQSSQSRP